MSRIEAIPQRTLVKDDCASGRQAARTGADLRRLVSAAVVIASAFAFDPAWAQPRPGLDRDDGRVGDVQIYRGDHYCWYEHAWRGSGWYRCGYEWRNGYGWGGGTGWLGWRPWPHHYHYPHPHPHPHPHRPPPRPLPPRGPGGGAPGGHHPGGPSRPRA